MFSHNFTLLLSLMVIFVASTAADEDDATTYIPPTYDHVDTNVRQCEENEIFTGCVEESEPTCQNPNPKDHLALICIPGCKCKEGFRRDENHNCVICLESSSDVSSMWWR